VYVNRDTFISATREFLKTSCTHETHYWGLNSLTMLRWTSTSEKFRALWVQRSKHFYSLFQNTDSSLNAISIFFFVINRLGLRPLDHTHGRVSPSQSTITTQNQQTQQTNIHALNEIRNCGTYNPATSYPKATWIGDCIFTAY